MTKKLTRAEKDQIIYNEGHGILHPEYYCYRTKSGNIQIRKRKEAITVPISANKEPQQIIVPEVVKQVEPPKKEEDYDSVSNKQLLEKMLEILEKNNNTNNNQNLNDPEREKEKEDNKKFIENIKTQEEKTPEMRAPKTRALEEPINESIEITENITSLREMNQQRKQGRQRGRRFIEPIKINNNESQIIQPIKKAHGRIL